jgi:hypothetical protein
MRRRWLIATGCLATAVFAARCQWIPHQCELDSNCPDGSYCHPVDKVCFDLPNDGGSGGDAGSGTDAGGGSDSGAGDS